MMIETELRMNEIRKLVDELNKCRNAYYNDNNSLISDREYDILFDKLKEMEYTSGIVYADSPTITVGYEAVSKLRKVNHNHPLLSLGKTTDIKEFADYFGQRDVCLMAKMDGLTASLKYVDGKLVLAESRGNGEVGEDITHNAKHFVNLPMTIPYKGELIVDGECIIDYDTFVLINEKHSDRNYKNPRNLVSGTVRQLSSENLAIRKVKFLAWKLYSAKDSEGNELECCKTFEEGFGFLKSLGFEVAPYLCEHHSFANKKAATFYYELSIKTLKDTCAKLRYPIDGIVGAFNDVEYGNSLGSTGHHPKHSLAFKFYQENNETTLLDVEWSTSRTGLVNPVAIVEPVEIDGTTVCRATLNNPSFMQELELGIGDTLTIIKANQIIPQIKDNLTRSNSYKLPKVCPTCGSPLTIKNDNGRATLYCTNRSCPAILHDKIAYFSSREGMNIMGLSEERLKSLIDKGYIVDFASIYSLWQHRSEICDIDGFGESSVNNLLNAIEQSKECKLTNVLVAIGIPGVGKAMAKFIAKHCRTLPKFIEMACNYYDWSIIDNIGKTMSVAINDYIIENRHNISMLVDILNIEAEESENDENVLEGQSFCITGKLFYYSNRDELVSDIEKYGGNVMSSVTKNTDYLITNDKTSGSSKNAKAAKYGTKIIDEFEFKEMIKNKNTQITT
jgi:DNA ligase (NAD+)